VSFRCAPLYILHRKYRLFSLKSAVMWCGVIGHVVPDVLDCSSFKTWVTTCPVTQFHISEDESTAVPLW